jgi:hypothetical protein
MRLSPSNLMALAALIKNKLCGRIEIGQQTKKFIDNLGTYFLRRRTSLSRHIFI